MKIKAVVYPLFFVAAAVMTYIFTIGKTVYHTDTTTMSDAGLPVIYMTTENGIKYNYLHGYTGEVNELLIHDALTPIGSDRKLIISVKQYGCAVSGISYEVSTTDMETLIERNSISDYLGRNGILIADFEFKNLLETGEEYLLKICLNTEKYGEVAYYTRMVKLDNPNTDRKLKYVEDFSENTRQDETLKNVLAKLEPDSTGDNTNLGRVNIHSRLSQVGFADLQPELLTDRYFTITEMDEERASVSVTYKAKTADDSGKYEYNIKEFYRIYQPDETVTYVYNFDRWMDQIFDPDKGISGRGEIYLGIRSSDDINMKNSSNGNISVFASDGELWEFSAVKNSFTKVFSFSDDKDDGIREEYGQHGIRIMNVYNNGNIDFLVYGYMNRGVHEGELGISVFRYDAANRITEEMAFIPRTDTVETIERDVDKLAYFNAANILYIYSNNSIIYLDCTTKEYMVVADNILPDLAAMYRDNNIFAYQTGADSNRCKELNILNLENGVINTIKAPDGEYIKYLGFIDGNIVYGELDSGMIVTTPVGDSVTLMHRIVIIDSEGSCVRSYTEDNVFYTKANFKDTQISFERMGYDEAGALVKLSDDSILSNYKDTGSFMEVVTRATEFRQKEQYIALVETGNSNASNNTGKYVFSSNSTVLISEVYKQVNEFYYSYGFGTLYAINQNISEAVIAAQESGGVVVDYNAHTIWNRYKPSGYEIALAEELLVKSEQPLVAATDVMLSVIGSGLDAASLYESGYTTTDCIRETAGHVYDLSGCSVDLALYYVGQGHPVIACTGDNNYELIYGYNSKSVQTYDFLEGIHKNYSKTEFDSVISVYGNILITY